MPALGAASASIRLSVDLRNAINSTEKWGAAFENTYSKLQKTASSAGYLLLSLKRIATYTGIFTFFGAVGKLVSDTIEYERALADVSTLLNTKNRDVADSFALVKQQLLELDPRLGSATEMAKGLYEIISAGVNDPVEAMKLLKVAAEYAKGGLTDLKTSAASLTSIMKAYGKSADEMRGVSDILFTSVQEGKYHVEELNSALGTVLPTAASMGVDIKEVAAAMAVLSQRGLSAGEAATALNRMLLTLFKPGKQAQEMFTKIGITWGQNAFVGKSLVKVIYELQAAQSTHADLLQVLFTRERGLRAAFILMGTGYQQLIQLIGKEEENMKGAGVTHEAAAKIFRTVSNELETVRNRLQQVAAASLNYSEIARGFVKGGGAVLVNLTRMSPQLLAVGAGWLFVHSRMMKYSKGAKEAKGAIDSTTMAQFQASRALQALPKDMSRATTSLASVQKEMDALFLRGGISQRNYAKITNYVTKETKNLDKEMAHLAVRYVDAGNQATKDINQNKKRFKVYESGTKTLQTLSNTLMIAGLAYAVLDTALTAYTNHLDAEIAKIINISNAHAARLKFMKDVYALQKQINQEKGIGLGGLPENMNKMARDMSISALQVKYADTSWKNFYKTMTDIMKVTPIIRDRFMALEDIDIYSGEKLFQFDEYEWTVFLSALYNSEKLTKEWATSAGDLARILNMDAKALTEMLKMPQFDDAYKKMQAFNMLAARMVKDFGSIQSVLFETYEDVASRYSKEDLGEMVGFIRQYTSALSDTSIAGDQFRATLAQNDISVEAAKVTLEKTIVVFEEALRKWEVVARKNLIGEYFRQYTEVLEKIQPSAFKAEASAQAIFMTWLQLRNKDDFAVKQFVEGFRTNLEQIRMVWNEVKEKKFLTPAQVKVFEDVLFPKVDKATAAAKAQEALKAYWDVIKEETIRNEGMIAQYKEKFEGDTWRAEYIRIQTQLKQKKEMLDQELRDLKKVTKLSFFEWVAYWARVKGLANEEGAAFNAVMAKNMDDWMRQQKEDIFQTNESWLDRVEFIKKQLKTGFQEFSKQFDLASILSPEQLATLQARWDKFWKEELHQAEGHITAYTKLAKTFANVAKVLDTMGQGIKAVGEAFGFAGTAWDKGVTFLEEITVAVEMVSASLKVLDTISKATTADFVDGLSKALAKANIFLAAMVVVGAIIKLFSGKSKAEKEADRMAALVKKIQSNLSSLGRVSESTAKDIAELSKKIGMTNAVLYSLGKIIGDTGVSIRNFNSYAQKLMKLLQGMSQWSSYYKEQQEAANATVSAMIEYLKDAGQEGTRAFLNIIIYARKYGKEIKAISEYVYEWLQKGIDGISKMIEGVDLSALTGEISSGFFEDLNKDIDSFAKGIKRVDTFFGESFGKMLEIVKELGVEGDAAFVNLIKKTRLLGMNVKEINEYVFEWLDKGVAGLNAMVGRLNFGVFEDVYQDMKKNEEELVKIQQELAIAMAAFEPVDKINEKIAELTAAIALAQQQLGGMSEELKAQFLPSMERAGSLILSTFNAFITQGKTASEAFQSIAEPLSTLRDRYESLGVAADDSLEMLFHLADLYQVNEGMIASIDGVRQVLQALGNTGFLTSENLTTVAEDAIDMFNQLQSAGLSQKEALMFIAPTLADLVYYAEQYGFQLDSATLALIEQAKELGVYKERQLSLTETMQVGFDKLVASLDEILEGMRGVFGSINDFLHGIDLTDIETMKDELAELYGPQLQTAATLLLSHFNALIAQGKDYMEALLMIKEPLLALKEKFDLLGLSANEALQQLFGLAEVEELNHGLIDSIDGMRQALLALGNTGFLTQQSLYDIGYQADEFYDTLVAGGATSQQALALISPMLADLVYYAEQYGFQLDTGTLALIAQAQAAGVYHERQQSLLDALTGGFNQLSNILYGLPDAMGRVWKSILDGSYVAGHAWDGFNADSQRALNNAIDVGNAINNLPTGEYDVRSGITRIAATGIPNVGSTELIRVHSGESILPRDISEALRGFFGGGRSGSLGGDGGGMAEVTVQIDGMKFYKTVVPYFKKGMRAVDMEVSGEGVF